VRIAFLGNFGVFWTSESYWAKSLEDLGHRVTRLQVGQASTEEILERGRAADLLVWVNVPGGWAPGTLTVDQVLAELRAAKVPTVAYHLDLWTHLARQSEVGRCPVYRHIEHFFSVDPGLVDWFELDVLPGVNPGDSPRRGFGRLPGLRVPASRTGWCRGLHRLTRHVRPRV